jgi:hypothetical protein
VQFTILYGVGVRYVSRSIANHKSGGGNVRKKSSAAADMNLLVGLNIVSRSEDRSFIKDVKWN